MQRLLVWTAFACCALVLGSFAMFARDQVAGASEHQQQELVAGAPASSSPPAATVHHGQPRRFIDDAARALTSPFRSLIQTDSVWAKELAPTLMALLVYGVGLGYLARFSRGMS